MKQYQTMKDYANAIYDNCYMAFRASAARGLLYAAAAGFLGLAFLSGCPSPNRGPQTPEEVQASVDKIVNEAQQKVDEAGKLEKELSQEIEDTHKAINDALKADKIDAEELARQEAKEREEREILKRYGLEDEDQKKEFEDWAKKRSK